MRENNLNTIIKNSFNTVECSRCTKIPDPAKGEGITLPFDYFGLYKGVPLYGESKLLKTNLCAFNLSLIEDHQYENLHFYSSTSIKTPYCLYSIGYYIPRKLKVVFFFDSEFVYNEKINNVTSFKKPQIVNWYEKGLFLPINYTTVNEKRIELISHIETLDSVIIKQY